MSDAPLLYIIAAGDLFSEEKEWLEKIREVVYAAKSAMASGSAPAGSLAIQIRPALSSGREDNSSGDSLQRVCEILTDIDPLRQVPVFFNARSVLPGQRQRLRLHLPEADLLRGGLPHKASGWAASAHNPVALREAQECGALFVVYGPVWQPQWKPATAVGLQALTEAATIARLPLLALGGITPSRVAACRTAGAAGVAVASGIMQRRDIAQALRDYLEPLLLM